MTVLPSSRREPLVPLPFPPLRLTSQIFDSNGLIPELVESIFEYLEDEDITVIKTSEVCKSWRNNPLLVVRQIRCTRLRFKKMQSEMRAFNEYPQDLVRIFRNSHVPIYRLPLLALGDRTGSTGYIDFIKPNEMTEPVMRFKDSSNRPGLALRIKTRKESQLPKREAVLAVFKRSSEEENELWVHAWGCRNSRSIERLYDERHTDNGHVGSSISECPTCPFCRENKLPLKEYVLSSLLQGTDPDFFLSEAPIQAVQSETPAVNSHKRSIQVAAALAALAIALIAYLANQYVSRDQK